MANTRFLAILILSVTLVLVLLPSPAAAFGAGNIASISKIEGHNWRHGDIEDTLKMIAFIRGHKWTSMMVKRVYFGNWLRDYSQALDVGTLKSVQAGTIRILVWVLSFLSFGYATGEFEVTEERLGVYRPEEHIDNPKDYADNMDARRFDPRLRGPVQQIELAIDPNTGMKNYIANESGGWATSSGYVKHSLSRSIHFGRVYTSGASGTAGKEADLCEALRCLGQALHCLEDFGAHSNYCELALRELGFSGVFPHTGTATEITLHGRRVFPLVTGSFGVVDFLHSVIGEVTDNFAASEVNELDLELLEASELSKKKKTSGPSSGGGARGFGSNPAQEVQYLTALLNQIPGGTGLCQQAEKLQADADAREFENLSLGGGSRGVSDYYDSPRAPGAGAPTFDAPPGTMGGPPGPGIPGMSPSFDPVKTAAQIYPILEFRDKVAKAISATIEKIPGLEMLVEKITETLTVFVLSLLAPFVRPIIDTVSKQLQQGSGGIVEASGKSQYEPWNNPNCTDPTHSLLSKDHFSNKLNEPAGQVAAAILAYVVPRILYAWEHPQIPEQQVIGDVIRVFHHPAIRDQKNELHRNMFEVLQRWTNSLPDRGASLNKILGAEGVKKGLNHTGGNHDYGPLGIAPGKIHGYGSHSKVSGSEWEKRKKRKEGKTRDIDEAYGASGSSARYSAEDYYSGGGYYDQDKRSKEHKEQREYKEKDYKKDKKSERKDKYGDHGSKEKDHRKDKKSEKKDKYYSDEDYDDGFKKKTDKREKYRDEDSDGGVQYLLCYKIRFTSQRHEVLTLGSREHKKQGHKHSASSGGHRGLDLSEDEDDAPTSYGAYKSHKPSESNPPYPGQQLPEQDFGYYAVGAAPQHQDPTSYSSYQGAPYGSDQYSSTYSSNQHQYQNPNQPPPHQGGQGGYPQAGYGGAPYPTEGYPEYGYGGAGQEGYGSGDGRRYQY
ncbi:hypothetical protein FGG08_002871 [Glutinoglossum americanum]|uniref:Het-C-domain-containing protein n=1 Tax=Glutinoglossum americanum TaxID=1670608 RepID=A0A9P8I3W6_9PEZI|nr:hypothetical protein FGG08_002871 [Glutinoglossum americanum]